MPSKVEMCNNALQELGDKSILDLTDNTERARQCNQRFNTLLDSLLCLVPWTFAMERLQLASDVDTPAFEFTYKHTLPSDCLQVLGDYNDYPYRVEGNYIFSDSSPIKLIYTRRIDDMNELSSLFVEMFQLALAKKLCMTLTGSAALYDRIKEDLRMAMKVAKSKDAQQGTPYALNEGEWLNIRSTGTGSNKVLL